MARRDDMTATTASRSQPDANARHKGMGVDELFHLLNSTRSAVSFASGIAAWLSCSEANVSRQLTGIPPSIASMCNLYPFQLSLQPFALRFTPVSQTVGKSASSSSSVSAPCRCKRVGCGRRSSPLRGRPRLHLQMPLYTNPQEPQWIPYKLDRPASREKEQRRDASRRRSQPEKMRSWQLSESTS